MNQSAQKHLKGSPESDPRECPLCGQPNDCQLCTVSLYKGPCWCAKVKFPEELLAQVPKQSKDKSCICASCAAEHQRKKLVREIASQKPRTDEFYFDGGMMVFKAAYHLRRGYCCKNGCRHCPYSKAIPPRVS